MSELSFTGLLDVDVRVLWGLIFGPATMQVLSQRTDIPATRLAPTCGVLVRRGFIQREGDTFSLTQMNQTVRWLKETRPGAVFPPQVG